jgi:aryl sulfotransferase
MTFVWLASYPKSGNTWVRVFLTNYRTETGQDWAWNGQLRGTSLHLERHGFDEEMGLTSADIPADALDGFRRNYHAIFARKFGETAFGKVHEAYASVKDGQPMFPGGEGIKAVYLIRDPRDIAPSYAHHEGCSIDQIIDRMADKTARMKYIETSFGEYLGSWSAHVSGWLDQTELPTLVLRYEDLIADPEKHFLRLIEFSGLPVDHNKLRLAIEASDFETLKSAESEQGYADKPAAAASFFRKGSAESWKEDLSARQAQKIAVDHGEMMQRFGYL